MNYPLNHFFHRTTRKSAWIFLFMVHALFLPLLRLFCYSSPSRAPILTSADWPQEHPQGAGSLEGKPASVTRWTEAFALTRCRSDWVEGREKRESQCLFQPGGHPPPPGQGFSQLDGVGKRKPVAGSWFGHLLSGTRKCGEERVALFRYQLRKEKACSILKVLVGNRS